MHFSVVAVLAAALAATAVVTSTVVSGCMQAFSCPNSLLYQESDKLDARDLAVDIGRNVYAPHFTSGCFDRIETSNVADYIGLDRVVDDWSPLLSRESCDASLLAYTMNWHAQQNDAPGFERFMPSSKDGKDVQIERTSRAMVCIRLHDYLLR